MARDKDAKGRLDRNERARAPREGMSSWPSWPRLPLFDT